MRKEEEEEEKLQFMIRKEEEEEEKLLSRRYRSLGIVPKENYIQQNLLEHKLSEKENKLFTIQLLDREKDENFLQLVNLVNEILDRQRFPEPSYKEIQKQIREREDSKKNERCDAVSTNKNTFVTKARTIWHKNLPACDQTPFRNIVRQRSGPHRSTETSSVRDTLKCIFSDEMVEIIVRQTKRTKVNQMYEEYNRKNPTKQLVWQNLTYARIRWLFENSHNIRCK